jgi:hypothetical protein
MRLGLGLVVLLGGCDVLLGLEEVGPAPVCPVEWDGAVHRYDATPLPWEAAAAFCRGVDPVPGDAWHTHLLVISNVFELAQLSPEPDTWIGLSDHRDGGMVPDAAKFRWITAEVTPPPPWDALEPDRTGSPRCGALDRLFAEDDDCADPLPFLCECDTYPDVFPP